MALETWRLIPLDIGDSDAHMALSDALVRSAAGHRPTVWWHATERSTLLLGPTGQSAAAGPDTPRIVRRPSGGGAVLARPGVLGLDVALPMDHRLVRGDIVEDYRWIGTVWEAALRQLGVDARVLSVAEARALDAECRSHTEDTWVRLACFGGYSPYEVVVGRRKIVGLSQVRRGGGVLLATGIHMRFEPHALVSALAIPASSRDAVVAELSQRAVGLVDAVGERLDVAVVMDAFQRALVRLANVRLRKGSWRAAEIRLADGRAATQARPPARSGQLPP